MKALWTLPLAALLALACTGSSADRNRRDVEPAPEPVSRAAPAPQPAAGPDLSYSVLDPKMEGETPIRRSPVFSGTPQTRLENGTLWAPVRPVVRVLAPQAKVTFKDGRLEVDGKPADVPVRLESGEPWAAVEPLARHFGAYARVHEEDGSVALWPREVLLWLSDHGDPQGAVVREAKAEGLLGSAH